MRGLPADSYPLPEAEGGQASVQRSPRRICAACQRNCAASTLNVEEHSSSRSPSASTAPQCRQTRSDIGPTFAPLLRSRKAARSMTFCDAVMHFSTIGSSCHARCQRNRALASFHFARSFSDTRYPLFGDRASSFAHDPFPKNRYPLFEDRASSFAHDPFPKTGTHFSGIVRVDPSGEVSQKCSAQRSNFRGG